MTLSTFPAEDQQHVRIPRTLLLMRMRSRVFACRRSTHRKDQLSFPISLVLPQSRQPGGSPLGRKIEQGESRSAYRVMFHTKVRCSGHVRPTHEGWALPVHQPFSVNPSRNIILSLRTPGRRPSASGIGGRIEMDRSGKPGKRPRGNLARESVRKGRDRDSRVSIMLKAWDEFSGTSRPTPICGAAKSALALRPASNRFGSSALGIGFPCMWEHHCRTSAS